jgi:hypothetical protein
MELLLLGWVLGLSAATAYNKFVIRPQLDKAIAELEAMRND